MNQSSLMKQKGFTILEVLLVVLLMGMAASAVVMSFGGANKESSLKLLANQFIASTGLVIDEAVLSGRLLGVVIEEDSYRYVYYEEQKWQPIPLDRLLTERVMEDDITLFVVIEGLPLTQDDEEKDSWFDEPFIEAKTEEQKKFPEPQILIFPSGEISSFELSFVSTDLHLNEVEVVVFGDSLGRMTVGDDAFD